MRTNSYRVRWLGNIFEWPKIITGINLQQNYLQRPYFIEVTDITTYSFVNFVEINSSTTTNGSITIYANLLEDITDIYATVNIIFQSTKGNYDLKMMNKTVDCCNFFRNKKYEPLLQKLYRVMTKTGTFPHNCPFRKVSCFCLISLVHRRSF